MKRIIFVDDEQNVLDGLKRMLRSMRGDYELVFATSGEACLAEMGKQSFDMVISDMRMPVMDGATLLTKIMERYPGTVRIILSGHSQEDAIFQSVSPAHQYLAKPCDSELIKKTIENIFRLRELLPNQNIYDVIAKVNSMPALPSSYTEINCELEQAAPSQSKIASIIEKDLGMSAKILHLLNSSFFGMPQRVQSIEHASSFLGLHVIKSLVQAVGVFSPVEDNSFFQPFLADVINHSMRTGRIFEQILTHENIPLQTPGETLFAGLLHDIGKLIFIKNFPVEYKFAVKASQNNNTPIAESELKMFKCTHAEAGAYLLGIWGFQLPVVMAAAFHHNPLGAPESHRLYCCAMYFSNKAELSLRSGGKVGDNINMEILERAGLKNRIDIWSEIAERTT